MIQPDSTSFFWGQLSLQTAVSQGRVLEFTDSGPATRERVKWQHDKMHSAKTLTKQSPMMNTLLNISTDRSVRNLYHQDRWGLVNRMAALHHVICFILMVGRYPRLSSIITNLPLPLCFCSVCAFDAYLRWITAVCSHERLGGAVTKQSRWW